MPRFEYVVAVTAPGGQFTHFHRGELYQMSSNEDEAAKEAIKRISKRYGFNLKREYSCVVFNLSGDDED